ncbi:hypothetical protein HDK77DRAFT_188446 [Phyllosticta capitalensis]
MGDTIKTFLRSGSLRKPNKSTRSVQSLPYTTAAAGAPPRQGLAPLKGDISPATHGIWTSPVETDDHLDLPVEQNDRSYQESRALDSHQSSKATPRQNLSTPAHGPENGKPPGIDAEMTFESSEEVEWDHTIGIALTTDHVRYVEHAERVGVSHRTAQEVREYEYPPQDPVGDFATGRVFEERSADQNDFSFDLQVALDKVSDLREGHPKSRRTSHGTAEKYGTDTYRAHTLTMVMEV